LKEKLDLDWVKSQDLSVRVIVGPSDLSRLRNLLLSFPPPAPGQCTTGNPAGTGYSIESVNTGIHVMG